jgi:DNA modification methylase
MSNNNKITVLGKTFTTEEERRTYFREELRLKLPELKKMEGFPIGEDEDILNLSDPPYYTACPNPWLNDFIAEWEAEKKELEKQGLRKADFEVTEPYAADVSEGKNNPIYMAHSYHTKVPHPAIMRYILHYTQPGDIVFDGFAGTGMTGVAASMCENPDADFKYSLEKESPDVKWGKRNAICGDLSPVASFIAGNYNSKVDKVDFKNSINKIIKSVENECDWMYKTNHSDGKEGIINYTVWSEVFACPNCNNEIVFFDNFVNLQSKSVGDTCICNNCQSQLEKKKLVRLFETSLNHIGEVQKTTKRVPVLISYRYKNKLYNKFPDKVDLDTIHKINSYKLDDWFPKNEITKKDKTAELLRFGVQNISDLYTKRNLIILSKLKSRIKEKNMLLVHNAINTTLSSILVRYNLGNRGNGILTGTYYIPSLIAESNIFRLFHGKIKDFTKAFEKTNLNVVQTVSGSALNNIPSDSVDYIFTDPPFGANIMYSELNFIQEGWLKVFTNDKPEAIQNKSQKKHFNEYTSLLSKCMSEFFRILKAGRWATVEFSNTNAAIWNSIQTTLQNTGFIISNVAALDKKQGSFNSVSNPTSVKQDLIISCYKPSSEFDQKFNQHKHSDVGVWEFVAEHLEHLPIHLVSGNSTTAIVERNPKILFDRLIAFYVQRGLPVPIDAGKFQQGLREKFIPRDGMFFTNEQVQEYDRKKAAVPNFVQLSIFVANEQDAIYWLRNILEAAPKTEQDLHPLWMKEVAGNMRKGDTLPEMRTILEENFLKNDKGQWYLPDPENEADLEKLRTNRLLKQFETYKTEAYKPKGKIKEARVEALRAGFKQCYQDKDFKTIVQIGDRIPNNLLMEDEVLLQFYDIAISRV